MADLFRMNQEPSVAPRSDAPRLVATLPVGDSAEVQEHVRNVLSAAQSQVSLLEALRLRRPALVPAPVTLEERVRAGRARLANERLVQEEAGGSRALELALRFARRVGQR